MSFAAGGWDRDYIGLKKKDFVHITCPHLIKDDFLFAAKENQTKNSKPISDLQVQQILVALSQEVSQVVAHQLHD